MSWFKRHLNWTLVMGLALVPFVALLLMPLHLLVGEVGEGIFFAYVVSIPLLLLFISAWHIYQKGRSQAHLLWLLWFPLGLLVILSLKSKPVKDPYDLWKLDDGK